MIEHLIDAITGFIGSVGYPGIYLLMTMAAACIPIPSEAILSFSGSLVVTDTARHFTWALIAIAGTLGDFTGASIAYWLGFAGGRPLILKFGRFVLIRPSDVDRAERHYARFGEWTVLFGRLIPLVRAFSSLPAGLSKMNYGKFVVFTLVGGAIWCSLLTYAGVKLGQHWSQVSAILHKADLAVIVVLAVLFGFWLWHHLRPEKTDPSDGQGHPSYEKN